MVLSDLEPKAAAGEPFTRAEAERVLGCADLVSVGILGETARRACHGDRVTYGQVLTVSTSEVPTDLGEARELRLTTRPSSITEACAYVRAAAQVAGTIPVTGFSVADLVDLAGGDHLVLADFARQLHNAGLVAVASLPIDQLEEPAELVRALQHGGLGVWRATVERAVTVVTLEARVDLLDFLGLIEKVADLQRETSALKAFAPLPVADDAEAPSTGYDDVRTIAVARLMCPHVPSIQVDWATRGPKLAQVAIAYGADDLDNVPAFDSLALGHRRSPREEIERQITGAFASPAARDGRFELVR